MEIDVCLMIAAMSSIVMNNAMSDKALLHQVVIQPRGGQV
jgi:hypothetical protein